MGQIININLQGPLGQYSVITANYWAFTLTDGALRMLILLYFYQQGFTPLAIASLFIFYELFGIVTNMVGGWVGARFGLNRIMTFGLGLQIASLAMLLAPADYLVIPWVMCAQAISGIAKDLNKMSAKSAVKHFIPKDQGPRLFRWVARLTGSKNALKGLGFFAGGALLSAFGFRGALLSLMLLLLTVLAFSLISLQHHIGKATKTIKFNQLFARSYAVKVLSAARLFLFCARDVWFVIALPLYLSEALQWSHWQIGSFLACWIIGYGAVQALAPELGTGGKRPPSTLAVFWASLLTVTTLAITCGMYWPNMLPGFLSSHLSSHPGTLLIAGLAIFAIVFAINSALHSYLIVRFAAEDGAAVDIGFYYMCNALGRLIGTLVSAWLYQYAGLQACLMASTLLLGIVAAISLYLPDARTVQAARAP